MLAQDILYIIFAVERNYFHAFLKDRNIEKLFRYFCLDKLIYCLNNNGLRNNCSQYATQSLHQSAQLEEQYNNDRLRNNYGMRLKV